MKTVQQPDVCLSAADTHKMTKIRAAKPNLQNEKTTEQCCADVL